jgi:hypothetical protein
MQYFSIKRVYQEEGFYAYNIVDIKELDGSAVSAFRRAIAEVKQR